MLREFSWFWTLMLLPEPIVSPPDTTWLFWIEDWDWLMLWSAEFRPLASSASSYANALFPEFFWFWKLTLLHDRKVVPPEAYKAFWTEACDWDIDRSAWLPFFFLVAKESSIAARELAKRANATIIAIDATMSLLFLLWTFFLFCSWFWTYRKNLLDLLTRCNTLIFKHLTYWIQN